MTVGKRIEKVAVYGTLKRGFRANYMMGGVGNLVGKGLTKPTYNMTDVGFPMIEACDKGSRVRVEVYKRPDWDTLDSYEGVPHLYGRRVVQIEMDDGEVEDAYIYEATDIRGPVVEPVGDCLSWG